jgi:amino acid adenylation domain-containing protein
MPVLPSQPADIVHGFLAQVRDRPDDTALVWRRDEISYRELAGRAGAAQARIAALGLAGGATVGVHATKSPDAIALILALLAAGRPFLLPSTELPGPTLDALFASAGCVAVLSSAPEPRVPAEVITGPDGTHELSARPGRDPDSAAILLTTSGSTGLPKVVPLTGGAVARFAAWAAGQFTIGPHRTVLNYAPLNFDLCLLDIWTTLSRGGRVVLVEPARATRADYLFDLLVRHRVHVVQAVPMCYQLLVEHGRGPLPHAEVVITTGDALSAGCLAELPRLFPSARLYNLYGCTETNDSFLHEIDPAAPPVGPVPIGEPIAGVSALLVDPSGAVVPGPGTGELHVSTPFQTPGYLDAAQTAAAFGPCPAGPDGRRYFRSGDLVRRHHDGSLTLEGRVDFQVKVRGVRVNPQEVERALLEHRDVAEAVVFALPDPVAGNTLHAVVRGGSAGAPHPLAVRGHCAELLPRPALPTAIHVVDEPLPTTSTGKPDRARIRAGYLERQR